MDGLKGLVIDAQTLKDVLKGVNDPTAEAISVADAINAIGVKVVVCKGGVEAKDAKVELNDYHFISAFEELALDKTQEIGKDGKPVPFELTIAPQALADVKAEDMANIMMVVVNPKTGEVALIELEAKDLNTAKNPPELTVILPFGGLFTFIQK